MQNPELRAEFKQKLANYLARAKEKPEQLQVWFWDETGFSLKVIRRKNWGKRGQRKKLTGQRRRGRVNIMGGLRESDRKRICFSLKKGNADTFYQQLNQFHELLKKEWVNKGNFEQDFRLIGPKIIVILDNAQELPNIILEFLPAYSPDFNIIELVWHSCKEYIAHRLFQSVEELEELVDRLLNQGKLTIKWQCKLKNKGNNHIAI